jgi:PAB1-binding protein PBP1
LTGADTKSHDLGASLKWVKLHKAAPGDNEEKEKEGQYVGGGQEKSMVFEPKDLVDIFAEKVQLGDAGASGPAAHQQNGKSVISLVPRMFLTGLPGGGFKTDADISGNIATRERELRRWQPEETPENGLSLDEQHAAPGQGWNQFEANERLFGIKSEFDENIYTTTLDRSHPQYQQREAMAAKIAADIEGQTSTSAHIAEERGLNAPDDSGMDEEDKFVLQCPRALNTLTATTGTRASSERRQQTQQTQPT